MPEWWEDLSPAQRLWLECFGAEAVPDLDVHDVKALVEAFLPSREAQAVLLKYGFKGEAQPDGAVAAQLRRGDGKGTGVSREVARRLVTRALDRLREHQDDWQAIRRKHDETRRR